MKKKKKNNDEDIFTESAPRLIQSSSCDVHGYVGIFRTLPITSRPLLGHHRSHDPFPGPGIGHSTRGQNWVNPHISLFVDALNVNPGALWTEPHFLKQFFPSFVSKLLAAHAKRFSVFWIKIDFKLYFSSDRIKCIAALLYRTNIVLETPETAIPTFRFTFCSGNTYK